MWALITSKVGGYIAGAIALLAGIVAIFYKGKSAGKQVEQIKRTEEKLAEVKQEAEIVQTKIENKADVQNEVAKLPDGGAADKLRSEWSRD